MIRLNLKTEPYWIDLGHGVGVKVQPLTPGVFSASQYYANDEIKKRVAVWEEKPVSTDAPAGLDMNDDNIRAGLIGEYMATFLAVNSIMEWEGVMNEKGPVPASVNKETVTALLQNFGMANTFLNKYTRAMDEVLVEGNDSGPEQSGTSQKAAGPGTAKGAEDKTSRAQKDG